MQGLSIASIATAHVGPVKSTKDHGVLTANPGPTI